MPIVQPSTYRAPFGLGGGHAQTLLPAAFRRIPPVTRLRERLETGDGDFLDIDLALHDDGEGEGEGSRRLAVVTHGLEGSSRQAYVQGMARALFRRGWNVAAWNLRGCSGEPNRLPRFYHSGSSDDLATVISHLLAADPQRSLDLVGFSLGGNITLRLLGEQGDSLDPRIRRAVVFSVPCDLASCADRLANPANRIYMHFFLRSLGRKIRLKSRTHPELLNPAPLAGMRTFREFDEQFTARLHGFSGAEDYWNRCSSRSVLPAIRIPTLLVNAANDPFLAPPAFPTAEAEASPHLHFECPRSGGHVGFITLGGTHGEFWSESRAADFLGG